MLQNHGAFDAEIAAGDRFRFGENWSSFLGLLNEERVRSARASLVSLLGRERLDGLTFLDIGSGSGLFSLAARQLGARVTSIDFDPSSVRCAQELKSRSGAAQGEWEVLQGSVLDRPFMSKLGAFDVVYSWGVLHHTGRMFDAIEIALDRVCPKGEFAVALYRKTWLCPLWRVEKRLYCRSPEPVQRMIRAVYGMTIGAAYQIKNRGKQLPRGMDTEHDLHDWLGGYPYESITPRALRAFLEGRGFQLQKQRIKSEGLHFSPGCDEYLFSRTR